MKKIITLLFIAFSVFSYGQDILMQDGTINQCTDRFFDSGGEFGTYSNDENFSLTICPTATGDAIQLSFTEFNTQLNIDVLTIYDGPDNTFPSLGSFSGGNNPGVVEATTPSGCLTIEFVSNGSGTTTGWASDIACLTPCQSIIANLDSTNPAFDVNNIVVADVNEVITFNASGTFSIDGTGATYAWDFGDSNSGTGATTTHQYATAGLYAVTLIITDTNPAGCTSTNAIDLTAQIGASGPGNPFVEAGDDIVIDCADDCTDITAEFLEIGETNTYTVSAIPFVPPFSFEGLTNSLNPNADDQWTDVENLPFDFCFFTNIETQFQVGSNGVISFDENTGGNGWQFTESLPNNSNDTLGEANILTPTHDIDPTVGNAEEIAWEIIGTAPNRVLAVSFFEVPMYSCTTSVATHMAVLYETTNVIDIYIKDKPLCTSWNDGNAAVGIQNNAGTTAFVPPGRNTGQWQATDEAWRFTPAGPSIIDFAWLDDTGAVIGTTPTLNVCPTSTTTYTAQVTYTNCNGDEVIVTDDVTVTKDVPFTVDLGPDQNLCEGDADVVLDADIASGTATYQWFANGILMSGEINPTLTVSSPNSDTYLVEVTDQSCTLTEEIVITFHPNPLINPISIYELCDDAVIDDFTEFDLSTKDAEVIGAQTDVLISYHVSQDDADNDENPLPDLFTNTVSPQTIFVRIVNANNPNCYVTTTFDLLVASGIVLTQPDDMVVCDDVSGDGFESFDLNSQTATILDGQTGVTLTYHPTQADAVSNTNGLTSPYINLTNPQTIFVRAENDSNTLCFETITFDLIVNSGPAVIIPTPLSVCDDDTDGFAMFTLSDANTEIINGQANVSVTYYETLADANTATNEIFSPYTNIVPNLQTVFVRLDDSVNGCFSTTTLDLEVVSNPTANIVTPLSVCDDDNDGFSSFELSLKDSESIGVQTGMVVTYHETESDAINGVNVLAIPYDNIVPSVQTVYIRVESGSTGCYDTVELILLVNPIPNTLSVTAYELCDYDLPGDEIEQFDLPTKDAEISDGQMVTVSYYETLSDAEGLLNPIVGLYSNTSNPQMIYYALVSTTTNCVATGSFELVVNPLPSIVVPTALEVCDDGVPDGLTSIDLTIKNQEIAPNPNYSVSYYLTQMDADLALNPLPIPYTNIVNGQIVFVRVQDINTGCYATTLLTLVVEQAPVANTPTPLEYCDADSDGFGVFTLTDADTEITSGDPALTVSYHETMADADNNVNALGSPYNNIVEDQQTIYVRVESATIATDCATIVELILIVHPTPQIEDPTPLEECDDVSADGFAQFDLRSKDLEILDGLDPLQYLVTYYEIEANAESGMNAILNPTNYTNTTAFNQMLWVRVEDTVNGCYKITTLELIVNALPVLLQPVPLELCDDNNPGDEIEAFTLEDSNSEMLNGQTGISFTYYQTQLDADNDTNPIVSPYMNTSNPQTVFVRATDDVTGCFVSTTATILLRVNPIPSPAPPTDLEVCDADNDGFEVFDLESKTLEIINGELDIAITYHETQSDADMDLNALVSPYTNIVMDEQMIYIRAENIITGCYNTSEVLIIRVLPSPEVPVDIDDYVICDTNNDGFAQFDLTTKDSEILGTQIPSDFILTYHITIGDAQSGNNPIVNVTNYTNVLNPQTIYVRLVSVLNGCVTTTGFFDIRVELPPEAIQPTPLELCDDEIADEVTVFDLTLKDNEITGGESSWSVSYYETDADAQSEINAVDAETYSNSSVNGAAANPQTLYVVVTDTDTGCVDYTTLTIRVLPNPTPSLDPDDLELCDDINPGDMEEEFDLTENEVYIINGESGVTATYHETEEDAELGLNAIVAPMAYTNTSTPQTIYVRVTNDITECYTLVTFDIIVNPLPDVVAVTDFILCELNTDGIDDFDLTLKDAEILNGQDATMFTVTYHETQTDADDLINALVSPYTNLTNPQQIFIAITNNDTGCSISTPSFNIEVQEAAEANSGMEPILEEICDDQMDDDGDLSNNSAQFDLTPVTDAVDLIPGSVQDQVLDGQDPANYILTYYETETDAELGVNPLPFLYENIVNPQIIYVRVDNDTLIDDGTGNMIDSSICYAVAPLTLQVNPLPVFGLDDSYILCVDVNGTEVLNVPVLDTELTTPNYEFEWSLGGTVISGATAGSYEPSEGGTYSVTVTDAITGCSSSVMTEVIESSPPTITLVDVTTDAFSELHIIVVTVTGLGDYEYRLDGGTWQDSNIFVDVSAGEHDIDVRDRIGCGYVSDKVTVMDYPTFFTPNDDGYNDTWNIKGIADQPSAKIYIFDRYGKLIKQISPTSEGWDGSYNGNPMPTSDYWFVVEYNEPNTGERKEFKAHFTLKR
ncbi:T9SS type B sorting domain-containing protein [Psychroserpens ponticola]|uniref:T9SS type B sorting domain-containing protein n=1 Tax=Psychroserpens ponticola TaxID=2932268 RepID=A0ABY7S3D8_9FLAO|nr:T9SS type B sorting domain-containing protein [Psychroserpens ponticola]WCO02430.1 T9SS type B sorting domain-containing protein [Psychroserpens ponticola]